MATEFALLPEHFSFFKSDGTLASGYQLFVYTAGSSSKATTHTESDGVTANANPIVLDARGETPNGVYVASGTYKMVLATDTDTDPPATPLWTRDNLSPINDTATTQSEWFASGLTPTFVNTTSFTLVGDQTSTFTVGRRLKTTLSGGTGYHTITISAFTSLTTVTVINDATVLDSGLTAVSYGLLSAANSSIPHMQISSTGLEMDGTFTLKQGADVASASDLDVQILGNSFDITGTTQIDTIKTKGVGTFITLQFDGALVLAHDATNLDLGDRNITTVAGDVAVFWEYAASDWRLVSYHRATKGVDRAILDTPIDVTNGGANDLTSWSFTAPAAGVTKAKVHFWSFSLSASDETLIQLGDSGGVETTNYVGGASEIDSSISVASSTSGFILTEGQAAGETYMGVVTLEFLNDTSGHRWNSNGSLRESGSNREHKSSGYTALDTELTTIKILPTGSDTGDSGEVNVRWFFD